MLTGVPMIPVLLHTALQPEAKPLIAAKNFKKTSLHSSFELFSNAHVHLVVSGSGIVRSTAALAAICTRLFPETRNFHIINIGIAGASRPSKIGQLCSVVKCIDRTTTHEYFPDLILQQPGLQRILETHAFPVRNESQLLSSDHIVDMEASAVFEAGRMFASSSRVQSFKVVSDHFEQALPGKQFISDLIESATEELFSYVHSTQSSQAFGTGIFSEAEHTELAQFIRKLRLTFSQEIELLDAVRYYKTRFNHFPDSIRVNSDKLFQSKKEKNVFFNSLKAELET